MSACPAGSTTNHHPDPATELYRPCCAPAGSWTWTEQNSWTHRSTLQIDKNDTELIYSIIVIKCYDIINYIDIINSIKYYNQIVWIMYDNVSSNVMKKYQYS